jgi:hypothetical protein
MFGGSNITEFIKVLNELSIIMKNKGETFRSLAYIKAINELKKYMSSPNALTINSVNDLKALKELQNVFKACKSTMDKFTAKTPHQSDEVLKNFKLIIIIF